MNDQDIVISIRDIQHYLYCPHRWGLIRNDCAWAENVFVTKANLQHKRVHDPDKSYSSRAKEVITSVQVYNDEPELNLYGVVDCIELRKDAGGAVIPGKESRYRLTIVEYKPTAPKISDWNDDDLMQVFAQKLCVDSTFHCSTEGVLYYADKKKRVTLPLEENYASLRKNLVLTLAEMRENMANGIVPPIRRNQKCSGCSMNDMCLPKLKSGKEWFEKALQDKGSWL